MFNSAGYSLADIAAATGGNNNDNGWGNDWWIILLFLFAGGWGNGGGWFGDRGNGVACATQEDVIVLMHLIILS